jgi:hypothetical protein
MNKLQVTAEQAKAIQLRLHFHSADSLINIHARDMPWGAEDARALNGLSVADLAKALYVGYEVPQPTPQEIFWAELNRPDTFIKAGDAVLVDGRIFLVVADAEAMNNHNCYINDAINWLDSDLIEAIYPVESVKEVPHNATN